MSDSSEDETTHAAEASEQSIRSETDSGETTSAANDSDRKAKQKKIAKRLLKSATAKRGVVYINRPPPYMRPDKVRHLLQQYADITRIYLAPEDETVRRRRRKEGGNRKQRYTEGWVEFASKKEVRIATTSTRADCPSAPQALNNVFVCIELTAGKESSSTLEWYYVRWKEAILQGRCVDVEVPIQI